MFIQEKKTALVTGASSGWGKPLPVVLSEGYGLRCCPAARENGRSGFARGPMPADGSLTTGRSVGGREHHSVSDRRVDVLVNNAGFGLYGPVEEIGIDEARYQFEVNLFGAAHLTQLLLPAMRARRRGYIVNISSMGGKMYSVLGAWYHATKHALEGWSDCLRLEVADFGIKVVIIEHGVIETGFGDAASESIVKRSATGPYGQLVKGSPCRSKNVRPWHRQRPADDRRGGLVAVKASNPRPRYAVGKYAKLLIRMRVWLGDRLFDRIILSQMR